MIVRLRAISQTAPITDDESDALTKEWNADFDEKDRPQSADTRSS